MKKIIVVGGTGLIGQGVVKGLSLYHEVIAVGNTSGSVKVDITCEKSIKAMYDAVGKIDAVIAVTGKVAFAPFKELTTQQYHESLMSKLMGQINLLRIGVDYLNEKGSFTLTSGILNHDPIETSIAAATVNGALEGFVTASAQELPRGLRVNLISPTLVTESIAVFGDYFKGYKPVPLAEVAMAYRKSVDGLATGKIIKVGY